MLVPRARATTAAHRAAAARDRGRARRVAAGHRRSRARPRRPGHGRADHRLRRVHVRRRPEPGDHARSSSTRSSATTSRPRSSSSPAGSVGKEGEQDRAVLARELAEGFLDRRSHGGPPQPARRQSPASLVTEVDRSVQELAQRRRADPIGMFRPPYGALVGAARARPAAARPHRGACGRSTRATGRRTTSRALRREVLRDDQARTTAASC